MENLSDLPERDQTARVLRVVRGPDWDFLSSVVSLDGCAFKTPVVREIPRPPVEPGPDYDAPQSDALAA